MKNIKNKLVETLKIATGRQLSKKRMKQASLVPLVFLETPDYDIAGFQDSQSCKNYRKLVKTSNPEEYIKIYKSFRRSPEGGSIAWDIDMRKTYNEDGKLKEGKTIMNSYFVGSTLIPGKEFVTIYDPAGSWKGKTTKIR